jgi:hypothetical protein
MCTSTSRQDRTSAMRESGRCEASSKTAAGTGGHQNYQPMLCSTALTYSESLTYFPGRCLST